MAYPARIVTLLPSATEIVCSIDLFDRLVGVTHECDYPPQVRGLPPVTASLIPTGASSREIDARVRDQLRTSAALYTLDNELLQRLRPDLIVTQALCDVCAVAESEVTQAARRIDPQPEVINLEPSSLAEVFETIGKLGEVCGVPADAKRCVSSLEARVKAVRERASSIRDDRRPRVALLEWIDPPFNAGHWNPELIELAGGTDCLGNVHEPSRTISFADIEAADPDILIVALCGFDADRARQDLHILFANLNREALSCFVNGQVHVLDGNALFSRPGPRLVDSLEVLARIIECRQSGVVHDTGVWQGSNAPAGLVR